MIKEQPTTNGSHAKISAEPKIEEETVTEETGIKDEPEAASRLEDPEDEDIKTITAGDTLYSSPFLFGE